MASEDLIIQLIDLPLSGCIKVFITLDSPAHDSQLRISALGTSGGRSARTTRLLRILHLAIPPLALLLAFRTVALDIRLSKPFA